MASQPRIRSTRVSTHATPTEHPTQQAPAKPNPTAATSLQLVDAIRMISGHLSLPSRKSLSEEFRLLQEALGLPVQDFAVDRRYLRCLSTDVGRLQYIESMKRRQQTVKNIQLEWSGDPDGEHRCYGIAEVAVILKRTVPTVRNYLSRNRGVWHTMVDERPVTVRRTDIPPVVRAALSEQDRLEKSRRY